MIRDKYGKQFNNGARKRDNDEVWAPGFRDALLHPGQNKWGGSNLIRKRGFRGGTYGPASPCRTVVGEEKLAVEADLKKRGEL